MGIEDPPKEDIPEEDDAPPRLKLVGSDEDELEQSVRRHPSAGGGAEHTIITEKEVTDDGQGL